MMGIAASSMRVSACSVSTCSAFLWVRKRFFVCLAFAVRGLFFPKLVREILSQFPQECIDGEDLPNCVFKLQLLIAMTLRIFERSHRSSEKAEPRLPLVLCGSKRFETSSLALSHSFFDQRLPDEFSRIFPYLAYNHLQPSYRLKDCATRIAFEA